MEYIKTKYRKLLNIVLIAMVVLFLFFCVASIWVTIYYGRMMNSGVLSDNREIIGNIWTSGISWMWIPTLLFLVLSIIMGRVVLVNKNQSDNDN